MVLKFTKDNRLFAPELNNLAYQLSTAVKVGCAVSQSAVPGMKVDVAAGTIFFAGSEVPVSNQTDIAIAASDPSFDRIDLVLLDSSGVASILTGTAAATPKAATYDPDTHLCIARVFVEDNETTILNADITDLRIISAGSGGGASSVLTGAPQSGCTDGDVVRFNGTNFVPAQADSIVNSNAVGIINNVSGGTGDVYLFGEIDFLSGLTAGTTYYLDETTAGALTDVRPALGVKIGVATSTTNLLVDIDRVIGGAGKSYTQGFTGTSITVTHNLNDSLPIVQVYDSLGEQITPDTIDITDANNVQLTFSLSTTGTAVVHSIASFATDTGTSAAYEQSFTTTTNVVVTHNLNKQYVVVQVYDNTDALIEPQSVVLDNANQCTVTFGSSTTGKVVVVGGSTFVSTAGSGDLLPDTDATYDVGAPGQRYVNGYFSGDMAIEGDVNLTDGLDSIKGGFGRIDIQSMAGDATSPPAQGFVGLAPTLDFDDTTDELAYFQFRKPADLDVAQDVTCEIVFCMASANTTDDVVLVLEANAIADGEDGTPVSVESTTTETVPVPDAADEYSYLTTSTLKIPIAILSGDQVISCRFSRDANNGADTATGDFRLISFRLKYGRL